MGLVAGGVILTVVSTFIGTGICGTFGHEGFHFCAPSTWEFIGVAVGSVIAAAVGILITRVMAEFVVVIFRIYAELRKLNS